MGGAHQLPPLPSRNNVNLFFRSIAYEAIHIKKSKKLIFEPSLLDYSTSPFLMGSLHSFSKSGLKGIFSDF